MNYSSLLKDIINKIKTLLLEVLIVNTVIYLKFLYWHSYQLLTSYLEFNS